MVAQQAMLVAVEQAVASLTLVPLNELRMDPVRFLCYLHVCQSRIESESVSCQSVILTISFVASIPPG